MFSLTWATGSMMWCMFLSHMYALSDLLRSHRIPGGTMLLDHGIIPWMIGGTRGGHRLLHVALWCFLKGTEIISVAIHVYYLPLELARKKVDSVGLVAALAVVPKGHGALNELQLTLVALLGSDIDGAVCSAHVTSWDLTYSRLVIHDDINLVMLSLTVLYASLFDHCIT